MDPSDPIALTIREATRRIRAGELSATKLTTACLNRIEELNPVLNAFTSVAADEALRAASAADKALANGEELDPLHGIPVALKDSFDVQGLPTTAGSNVLKNNIAEEDSEVARRLRRAGAIILGKLNMHEWGFGITTRNDHFGWCRNPWDPSRIPGGSSGGSGAAVAAGLCLGSIGEDTGGSARFPAALNGIVGLRPSFGLISLRGSIPIAWSYDTAGPIARTVFDVAMMTHVLAGFDPRDPVSVRRSVDDYTANLDGGIEGVGVGIPENYFFDGVQPEVAEATFAAIDVLESLGARRRSIHIPNPREAFEHCRVLIWSEAAAYHKERMETDPDAYSSDTLEFIETGSKYSGMEYARARHSARAWHRTIMQRMDETEVDVIVTPCTSIPAPPIEKSDAVETTFELVRQVYPFSLVRLPGLAIPSGFVDGLPIGMHVLAKDYQESLLFRLGYAYQQRTDWHTKHPPLERLIQKGVS